MGKQLAGFLLAAPFWLTVGVLPASLCLHFVSKKKWLHHTFTAALIVCGLGAAVYYWVWIAIGGIKGIGPGMIDMTDAVLWHMTPAAVVACILLAVDILQIPLYVAAKRVCSQRQKFFFRAVIVCSAVVSAATFVPFVCAVTVFPG